MANYSELIARLIKVQLLDQPDRMEISKAECEDLIRLSIDNQIDSITFRSLLKCDLDVEKTKELKSILLKRFMISSQQMEELQKIQQMFESLAIRHHVMKGSVLKYDYPMLDLRQMSDLDILVDECDLVKAHEVINSMGYEFISKESHHDTFMKSPYLRIELHRSLYDGDVDSDQHSYFGTFKRSILVDGWKHAYKFTNEDFYVYMMAHMAKHFYKMGCGVRNLVDIYVFYTKYQGHLDEEYIREQLANNNILVFANHMKEIAFKWLDGETLSTKQDHVVSYMLDSGIYGKDENGIWNKFAKEKTVTSSTSKYKLKLWYYFPPYYYMRDYYKWISNKPWLLPVAWAVRGFSGLFNRKGTHKRQLLRNADAKEIGIIQEIYREMQLDFHVDEDH